MLAYLSEEWFDRLEQLTPATQPSDDAVVVRHRVTATPFGPEPVSYDLVVGHPSFLRRAGETPADLRMETDYVTAREVAAGRLSAYTALSHGRIVVGGNLKILSTHTEAFTDLDPLSAQLRAETDL